MVKTIKDQGGLEKDQLVKEKQKIFQEYIRSSFLSLERQLNSLQKSIDLVFEDRKILEEILDNDRSIKELMISNREHQDITIKDVKAEVVESGIKTEEKIGEVSDKLQDKTIILKESLFEKLRKKLNL